MIFFGQLETVFGAINPDDLGDDMESRKAMVRVGRAATKAGLAIVVDKPGEKIPVCTLTAQQRNAADQAARDAAAEAGKPRAGQVRHACGLTHAITDPDEALKVLARMAKRDRFNLGVEPRKSGLIIVDLDDPDQIESFKQISPAAELTVSSPGAIGEHGDPDDVTTWAHFCGGHIYYTVPEGAELPEDLGTFTDPEGKWKVMWGECQALIPPSRRREGAYQWIGNMREAPPLLISKIMDAARLKRERVERSRLKRESTGPTEIDTWSVATSWDELLIEDGWSETGTADNCSCPIWTAPGDHGSPKSATAHEPGCTRYDCERGHGPLYVWTDDPQSPAIEAAMAEAGGRALTKAQVAAHVRYGGSMGKLRSCEAGVIQGIDNVKLPPRPDQDDQQEAKPPEEAKPESQAAKPPEEVPEQPTEDAEDPPVNLPDSFWTRRPELEHIRKAAYARGVGADGALLAVLTRLASVVHHKSSVDLGDGPASLNLVGMVVGPSGAGKSRSMGVARELIELPSDLEMDGKYRHAPMGTGEGLIEMYWGLVEEERPTNEDGSLKKGAPKKIRQQVRHNAYAFTDEAEGWIAAATRPNSTALSIIRSMWSGQPTGQSNSGADNTRHLDERDYAWGCLMAVQPEKAEPLFDDAVGGTPQRFLFAKVTDPNFPIDSRPDHPGVLRPAKMSMRRGKDPEPVHYTVPESIAAPLRYERGLRVAEKAERVDDLDAHQELALMKVSALLAILAGHDRLTVEDWHLAEMIWKTSKAVRAATLDVVKEARADEARAREEREAKLHVWKAESAELARTDRGVKLVERVAAKIGRKVWAEGDVSWNKLRGVVHARDVAAYDGTKGQLLDLALTEAVSTGYVAQLDAVPRRYGRGPTQPET